MKVSTFIEQLASAVFDTDKMVLKDEDWQGILISQSGELFPEIAFNYVSNVVTSTIQKTFQIDMSDKALYPGCQRVRNVFLIDQDGRKTKYNNWVYYDDSKMLELMPDSQNNSMGISTVNATGIFPISSQFPTLDIVWLGELTTYSMNQDLTLEPHELDIFKKICIKEAINRILLDHVKLDRFRTLLGRANEYALIAIKNSLQMEIDNRKKKLSRTNPLKSF